MILPVLLLMGSYAGAQTVIITDDPDYESGEASAVLDVKSEAGGFLLPRMTQAQRDAIDLPATGLLVFQIDGLSGLYYNAGSAEEPAWHILEATHLVIEKPAAGHLWDVDGNRYDWVRIGGHEWMASNLRVTRFRNGESIPVLAASSDWIAAGTAAMAWYDGMEVHAGEFGALYNRHVLQHPAGICPEGWQVPTEAHWQALAAGLGGQDAAGMALKAARYWDAEAGSATNVSGFAALPAGLRDAADGQFVGIRSATGWWVDTGRPEPPALSAGLQASGSTLLFEPVSDQQGLSLRCVKQSEVE